MKRMPVIAAVLPAAQALACMPPLSGDGLRIVDGARHVVAWRAPARAPLAEFFALDVGVCARDGRRAVLTRVDATMPAHGHGMNYRPSVTALGDGRFRADGLLLHMPGRWALTFSVGGDPSESLGDTLDVD